MGASRYSNPTRPFTRRKAGSLIEVLLFVAFPLAQETTIVLWTLVGCCYLLCNISFDRAMEENEMVSGDNHTRAVMLMMIRRLSQDSIHIRKLLQKDSFRIRMDVKFQ